MKISVLFIFFFLPSSLSRMAQELYGVCVNIMHTK